jgi:CheY-like chemotaxis protein
MARILIAEDDDSVRAFVARALTMDAHETVEATDGEEGLELLADGGGFDLLLSDIRMPGLDGIALARRAAKVCPDMAILLMTGYADQREKADDLDGIVTDVILKPFTLAQIRSRVGAALTRH